jgi:DNA polymerase-3 subunit gamma/tau
MSSPAPPVQAAPAAAAAKPAPQLGTEIERLKASWREIIAAAPPEMKKSNAIAILRSGSQPTKIEGDLVILSFRSSLIKEKMDKPENIQLAEKIVSGFLGRTCQVRCVFEPPSNHLVQEAIKLGAQQIGVEEQ